MARKRRLEDWLGAQINGRTVVEARRPSKTLVVECKRGHRQVGNSASLKRYAECLACLRETDGKGTNVKHGQCIGGELSLTYSSWRAMMGRCYEPTNTSYPNYGGRGIIVDARYHTVVGVIADLGERPSRAYTLGRIDHDKNYEPGNIQWETYAEQALNKRDTKFVDIDGEVVPVAIAARRNGIRSATAHKRIREGWTIIDAVTTPVGARTRCSNRDDIH